MKHMIACLMLLILFASFASAQTEFIGQLDAELSLIERLSTMMQCKPVSDEEKAKLPTPLAEGDQAFTANLYWQSKRGKDVQTILVEAADGKPFIYADTNLNGKLEADERYYFSPIEDDNKDSRFDGQILLKLPLTGGRYKHYPLLVRHFKADDESGKDQKRYIGQTIGAFARGTVDIDGRKTRVLYRFDIEAGNINPKKDRLGVDGNGDGQIDMDFVSPEAAYADDETVVFRAGNRYISTKSVDPETGRIILRSHPESEYRRIELHIGAEVPDFSFTDFGGKSRKLSEFRGKYVLVEFWGTWCGPCVGEIPHLKKAYEKYSSRGFEILGMDEDKDINKVKEFLAEKGMTWTQATPESIKELVKKRFRITAYPTTMLLDPQGRIISLGRKDQPPLRGEKLFSTLEKILPMSF